MGKGLITLFCSGVALVSRFSPVYAAYECTGEDCPPELTGLQDIVLRMFTLLITFVGLILLFLIVQSGIGIMTSADNEDKKAKAVSRLKMALLGTVGIFLSYTAIVFIARWLGLTEGALSFVSGSKIIFSFILPGASSE